MGSAIWNREHRAARLPRWIRTGIAAILIGMPVSTAAMAEALVLSAQGGVELSAGQILPPGRSVTLAPGERAELLLDTGAVVRLVGPARYVVQEGAQPRQGLLRALADLLAPRTPQVRLGGMRTAQAGCGLGESADWIAVEDAWSAGCRRSARTAAERLITVADWPR